MKERLQKQHELLGTAREALGSPSALRGEPKVLVLLGEIDREAAEFDKRFGGGSAIAAPTAAELAGCNTV